MSELTTLTLDREIVDTVDALGGGTLSDVYQTLTTEGTRPHLRGQMVAIRWHRLLDAGVLATEGAVAHVEDRGKLEGDRRTTQVQSST
jgi:hypothetical protein